MQRQHGAQEVEEVVSATSHAALLFINFLFSICIRPTHVSPELLIGGGIGGGISEFMVARTCSLSATGEGDSVKLLFLRDFLLNLCPFFTLKIPMLFRRLIIAIKGDGGGGGGGAFGLDSWAFLFSFLRS